MERSELLEQLKQPRILADIAAGCITVLGLFGCFHQSPPIKTLSLAALMAGVGTFGANTLLAHLYAETAANVLEKELHRDRTSLDAANQSITSLNDKIQQWETFWQTQLQQINALKAQQAQEKQALAQALERSRYENSELSNQAAHLQSTVTTLQHRIESLAQQRDQERQQFHSILVQFTTDAKLTLSYAVSCWRDNLCEAIAYSLQKHPTVKPRLLQLQAEIKSLSASYDQQIAALTPAGDPARLVDAILSLLHHAATEFSSLKVKYRNTLNVGDTIQHQAQIAGYKVEIEDLKRSLERLQKDAIPREQHEAILTEFQLKKDEVVNHLLTQTDSLETELRTDTEQYVQKLIGQLEQATREIATLKNRVQEMSKPQLFAPATRDDMRMANVVIAYFEALGVVLDRAYSDYRKWEAILYFHTDRNRKVILHAELNEHSDRLRQLLNCLNEVKFEYDADQGLMRLRVQISAKPKADTSEIHKLWKRHDQFEAIVQKWERVRVTGGSESGKSPTAENIAICILKHRAGEVKLANPMHDSKKNYWTIPVVWKSHKEAAVGLKELADRVERRASGEESRDQFVLYVFDEVDSTMEAYKTASGLIKTAIKQVSHQNLGAIFIGQNANATNYKGMDRSDWNNAVNVHIGSNAYDAITNSNLFTSKEQTELKERADRLSEYCLAQNQALGFDGSTPEGYRFALVIEPNKKPYFIELPYFGCYTFDQINTVETLTQLPTPEFPIFPRAIVEPAHSNDSQIPISQWELHSCPHCQSSQLKLHERKAGSVRYRCLSCRKTHTVRDELLNSN